MYVYVYTYLLHDHMFIYYHIHCRVTIPLQFMVLRRHRCASMTKHIFAKYTCFQVNNTMAICRPKMQHLRFVAHVCVYIFVYGDCEHAIDCLSYSLLHKYVLIYATTCICTYIHIYIHIHTYIYIYITYSLLITLSIAGSYYLALRL